MRRKGEEEREGRKRRGEERGNRTSNRNPCKKKKTDLQVLRTFIWLCIFCFVLFVSPESVSAVPAGYHWLTEVKKDAECRSKVDSEPGELVHWLRATVALAEDLGSILSSNVVVHNHW